MRSTPCPKLILRTVKLACGPLSRLITTPSNACTRSLSPSLIFTCTRTVSPGRNAGRSVRWVLASSFSIIRFDMFFSFLGLRRQVLGLRNYLFRCSYYLRPNTCFPAFHAGQNLVVFLAEFHALQQIRTVTQRLLQSLFASPAPDLGMV